MKWLVGSLSAYFPIAGFRYKKEKTNFNHEGREGRKDKERRKEKKSEMAIDKSNIGYYIIIEPWAQFGQSDGRAVEFPMC
jgi:hypothetical protein